MGDRLINMKQVIEKTGVKRSTIYHKIKTGEFPPGSKRFGRRVWWESEIDALFPPPSFPFPPTPIRLKSKKNPTDLTQAVKPRRMRLDKHNTTKARKIQKG